MRILIRQLVGSAVRLGAIGLIAVGLSGGVALLLGTVAGTSFVSGDAPSVRYTVARCADYREYAPSARTCEQAATAHHFGEVVDYRVAAGLLGGAMLGGLVVLRRRRPDLLATDRLPVAFEETVAATLFGAGGMWLLAFGIDQVALGDNGAGFFLSGGIVAVLAATWFAARFQRQVLRSPAFEG